MSKSVVAAFLLLIMLMSFTLRVPGMAEQLAWDEGLYAYTASRVADGDALYKDVLLDKEPGIFFLYGFVEKTLGDNSFSIRLFGTLWVLAALLLVFFFSRRLGGDVAGIVSAFFFGLAMSGYNDAGVKTNTEVFMTLFSTAGYLLSYVALSRRKAGYLFAAGIAVGLNISLKLTAVMDFAGITAFAMLVLMANRDDRQLKKTVLSGLPLMVAGVAVALLPFGLYLWHKGALSEAWQQIFLWRFQNLERDTAGVSGPLVRLREHYGPILRENAGLAAAASLSALGLLAFRRDRATLMLAVWLVFSFAGVSLTGRFAPYYFPFMIPPLALLAGYGASLPPSTMRPAARWLYAGLLASLLAGSLFMFYRANETVYRSFYDAWRGIETGELDWKGFQRATHPDVAEIYDAAEYVKARTKPGDRVYYWTNSGEFYWHADRMPASRYLATVLPGRNPASEAEARREVYEAVTASPPAYIAVRDAVMAYVIPPYRSTEELESFKVLHDFIRDRYVLEKIIGRVLVYRYAGAQHAGAREIVMFPEFMSPTVGYGYRGAWYMYSNGSISRKFDIGTEADADVYVRAMGRCLKGQCAKFRVYLDGVEAGSFEAGPDWDEYSVKKRLASGAHSIRVEYYNDAWDPSTGQGTDLYLDRVVIECTAKGHEKGL